MCAMRGTRFSGTRGRDGMLPIHYAIQHHASSDVVLKLLEEYPNSAVEMHSPEPPKPPLSTIDQAVFHGCSVSSA